MPCAGNFLFSLVNGQYTATLSGWSYLVYCVGTGASGWRLRVTDNLGNAVVYNASVSSVCTPTMTIIFQNVLIHCGIVNITLSANLADCNNPSASAAPGGVVQTLLHAGTNNSGVNLVLKNVNVGSTALLVVVAASFGVNQGLTATFGPTPIPADVQQQLPITSPVQGQLSVLSVAAGGAQDVTISAAITTALSALVFKVDGLAARLLDKQSSAFGTTGNPAPGTTGVTTAIPEMAVGAFATINYSGATGPFYSGGFTHGSFIGQTVSGFLCGLSYAWLALASLTSVNPILTSETPSAWTAICATYR